MTLLCIVFGCCIGLGERNSFSVFYIQLKLISVYFLPFDLAGINILASQAWTRWHRIFVSRREMAAGGDTPQCTLGEWGGSGKSSGYLVVGYKMLQIGCCRDLLSPTEHTCSRAKQSVNVSLVWKWERHENWKQVCLTTRPPKFHTVQCNGLAGWGVRILIIIYYYHIVVCIQERRRRSGSPHTAVVLIILHITGPQSPVQVTRGHLESWRSDGPHVTVWTCWKIKNLFWEKYCFLFIVSILNF